jgi:ABC-type amino acid transport substrate-binding protein
MRTVRALLAGLAAAVALTGCSQKTDSFKMVQQAGTLRVLVAQNSGIYSRSAADGSGQEGIEIEIAREIASDLGVALQTIPMEKNALLGALSQGEGDLAIGRLPDNDSLRHNYAASIAYETGRLYAVTPRGVYFPTAGSLQNKTIGISDQLSEPALIATAGILGVTRLTYADTGAVEQNLTTGAIAAYLCYDEQAQPLSLLPALQVQNMIGFDSEQYVVAAAQGAQTLIAQVNHTLTRLLEGGQIEVFYQTFSQ